MHPVVLTAHTEDVEREYGVRADNIDRFTFAFDTSFTSIITTRKPFDRMKALGTLVPESEEKIAGGKSYYESKKLPKAVYLIDERTLLVGTPQEIKAILERSVDKKGAVQDFKGTLAVAVNRPLLFIALSPSKATGLRETAKQVGGQAEPFLPLLEAKTWRVTLEKEGGLRLRLRAEFASDGAAKKAVPALTNALKGLDDYLAFCEKQIPTFLQGEQKKYEGAKELAGRMETVIQSARAGLKVASPRALGNVVEATAHAKTDTPITDAVLLLSLMPRSKKQ
jgi:hypothetical protein